MQNILVTMVKNPNVERIIDFIAKFAVSLSSSSSCADKTSSNQTTVIEKRNEQTQSVTQTTLTSNNNTTSKTTTEEIENPFLNALLNYLLSVIHITYNLFI